MEQSDKDNSWRWNILQEQLISLWIYNKSSPGSSEFQTFLTEGFTTSSLSLSMFNHICFFLLGLINRNERDKLINWPIINIRGQAKFRKGVSHIVKDLIEKYPNSNLKRLPESYLMDPNHNQEKILEFLIELCDLAIYSTLDDTSVLIKNFRSDLNASEIETSTEIIRQARINAEQIIEENEFPLITFENVKINITNKCVSLKQENSNLYNHLNNVKKKLIDNKVIEKDGKYDMNELRDMVEGKINELKQINGELECFKKESKNILQYMTAVKEPVQLTADDLNMDAEHSNFMNTVDILDKLNAIFDFMRSKDIQEREKEEYYNTLQNVKKALMQEQNALQSFIHKHSQSVNQSNNNL